MKDFILTKAKAFVAAAVPAIIYALLTAIETVLGFQIGEGNKLAIASAVSGLLVYQVPNKKA